MKKLFLSLILSSSFAHAGRFLVEAKASLKLTDIKIAHAKVESFYPTTHEYFSRLYVITGKISEKEISKLAWVQKVEMPIEVMTLSLLPSERPKRLVKDELFPYQWGLSNQGQTFFLEKDDIHNIPMNGVDGKDIGWEKLLTKLSANRPIVAVLDSGVDLTHPELVNNLWKNEKECGKDPKVDNDENKLAGDCNGWNFTESMDSDAAKDPSDNDGHGTHVASIIAAASDGRGMVGVNPNALIMPIKVIRDSNSKSDIPSSEAFARGIIYAVENGAQVINMSLGWPQSLETKLLREAVTYALSRGVVIVAAAGNNNSSEPLYPCAYEGVVCVAASTLNGNFAGFSNFGGHVDTIAPGEGILGAHPTAFEPENFSVTGYEVRSGSSQSAPFVSGLIASVLAEKKLKIDEILGRIYQGKNFTKKNKHIMGSEATWEMLSQEVAGPVLRPIFKRVRQIIVKGDTALVTIPVRNFGLKSEEGEVTLMSLSEGVTVVTPTQKMKSLDLGEWQDVTFELKVQDFSAESDVTIKITMSAGENTQEFMNEIPVVREIRGEANYKKINFHFANKPLPVGSIKEGKVASNFSTLESFAGSHKHELFMRRLIKEGEFKKLELIVFTRGESVFKEAPKPIYVDDALTLVNFIRVDMNLDGEEDYLIQTIVEKDGKKSFRFSFYNSKMETLWPSFQDATLNLTVFMEDLSNLSFIGYEHPELGKIRVPAFFTNGQLPVVDQVITTWEKYDSTRKKRLYYLQPKGNSFDIRSLTTKVWEEALKKELKSKWYDTVEVEQLLPVSKADIEKNQLRVMVSAGLATKRQLFIYNFNTKSNSRGSKLPQLVLQTEEVDPLLNISSSGLEVSGDVYFNIYDRERSKLVVTRDQKQVSELIYRHESETDLIAGHIASFEDQDKRFTVLQTREELISITAGQNPLITKRAKLRYSFLSQRLLSELYHPVTYARNGKISPALYVDATAVTGFRVYLYEEQQGKLVSSIQNSIAIPNNCKVLNPSFSTSGQTYEFIFLCLENQEWAIRSFEMN